MDYSNIRLEPEYITKYGKPYHVLYQKGAIRNKKEFEKFIKNKYYVSCWEGYNDLDEEEYEDPYEDDEYDFVEILDLEEDNYSQYYSSSSESDEELDLEFQ